MGFAPDYIACVLGENFEDAERSRERLASDMAAAQSLREQLASACDRLRKRSRAL